MKFRTPLLLVLSALLAGCTANGQVYENAAYSQESAIVVYRPWLAAGSAAAPKVSINDSKIGTLKVSGYIYRAVPPGKYIVKTIGGFQWGKGQEVSISVKPKRKSYIRLSSGTAQMRVVVVGSTVVPYTTGEMFFGEVPPEIAISEIAKLREVE
jgi:hypothetical protein